MKRLIKRLWILPLLLLLASPAWATITFDATTISAIETGDFTWSHTAGASPEGALVCVVVEGGTDEVVSVDYGSSTSIAEVTGSPNLKTTGEASGVHCFFLGSSLPGGTQTVTVDVDGTGSEKFGFAVTINADADTEENNTTVEINSDSNDDPAVTLTLGSMDSFVAMAFFAGGGSRNNNTPWGGWTGPIQQEGDLGVATCGLYYHTTIISSNPTDVGWQSAAADDTVAIGVAIKESAAGAARRVMVVN